jgi:protein gp37/ParB-like chromosome segregation protein Spo0J
MKQIALADLRPHPSNPRLAPRVDVIEQIVAQLDGKMDEAHALIVRPFDDGFQIISGHNRFAAATKAGLATVPCWVREMLDADAYMALALNNAQGELHPLEVGMHALKSGIGVREYAERMGQSKTAIGVKRAAASVADACPDIGTEAMGYWSHLAEIHAAPKWLWSALVSALIEKDWSVETTRKAVKKLADLPAPPDWTDADIIADRIIAGDLKIDDVKRFPTLVESCERKLRQADVFAEELIVRLGRALESRKPIRLSEVGEECAKVESRQAKIVAWRRGREIAAQRKTEESEARARRRRKFISLEEWKTLASEEQAAALAVVAAPGEARQFNKQENADIEWAQWSWNPITGCLHDCVYCYARDIALNLQQRTANSKTPVYETGFAPTIYPLRLLAPQSTTIPKEAQHDTRFRNVFTGSMADIFGRWVPAEWIEAVLAQVRAAPQWNFLFLTKFPNRMAEFDIPQNAWVGTSVDLQARVPAAEKAFAKVKAPVKWLSVEPMLEPLTFRRLDLFDWIVIGGASASRETPEWKPPFAWVYDIVRQAREAGTKVYFKTNLLGNPSRILELPFEAPIPQSETELPEVFRYLGKSKDHNTAPESVPQTLEAAE